MENPAESPEKVPPPGQGFSEVGVAVTSPVANGPPGDPEAPSSTIKPSNGDPAWSGAHPLARGGRQRAAWYCTKHWPVVWILCFLVVCVTVIVPLKILIVPKKDNECVALRKKQDEKQDDDSTQLIDKDFLNETCEFKLCLEKSCSVFDMSGSTYAIRSRMEVGPMPSSIGQLVDMEHLNLEYAGLNGPIPTEIGLLSAMEFLNLESNELTGTVPSEIANISQLKTLRLGSNILKGPLPTEIGQLSRLEELDVGLLAGRSFQGTGLFPFEAGAPLLGTRAILPTEIGSLASLKRLYANNLALGEYEASLYKCHFHKRLAKKTYNSDYCKYSGEEPATGDELCECDFPDEYPDEGARTFVGTIPTEIGQLASLEHLRLDGSSFTGTIPTELGVLTNLTHLVIHDNELLEGTLPSELFQLPNLVDLVLMTNALTGTLPTEIGLLSSLKYLRLGMTSLSGNIPTEIGMLSSLRSLHLDGTLYNDYSGPPPPITIPTEIGRLTELVDLLVTDHGIKGTIPTELGRLSNLETLSLTKTLLTGTLPSELGQLTNLTYLKITDYSVDPTFDFTVPPEVDAFLRTRTKWEQGQEGCDAIMRQDISHPCSLRNSPLQSDPELDAPDSYWGDDMSSDFLTVGLSKTSHGLGREDVSMCPGEVVCDE